MSDSLKFHHFGLALRREDDALTFLKHSGYEISEKIFDPEQNVHLRMCTHSTQPSIEMVLPGEGDGPLTPILKRYSELIYHLCYECGDVSSYLNKLEHDGVEYTEIAAPKPAILFGGRPVSFYHIRGFGLIEIIEP
jgi:methylmalonyl-CoA/ethylmalonyl-CoA epimerase